MDRRRVDVCGAVPVEGRQFEERRKKREERATVGCGRRKRANESRNEERGSLTRRKEETLGLTVKSTM